MPFDINGFLGEEALKMSEQIREKYKELFEFCCEMNRFAQRTMSELKIDNQNLQEIFFVCFLACRLGCAFQPNEIEGIELLGYAPLTQPTTKEKHMTSIAGIFLFIVTPRFEVESGVY